MDLQIKAYLVAAFTQNGHGGSPTGITAAARMFAPNIGVKEDLINGNSSGCMGTWLLHVKGGDHLYLPVHQGQWAGHPGTVHVDVKRSGNRMATVIGGTVKMLRELEVTVNTAPQEK